MTRMVLSLNRKEMFSASMVMFLGLYYTLVFSSSLFKVKSSLISMHVLLLELKWLLSGLLFLSGGILMFMKKKAGWIISTATLLNFILIVFMNIVSLSQIVRMNAYTAITIGFFVLLFMGFVFLFGQATRIKFVINNKSYLLTIALYLLLTTVTFWV